MDKNSVYKTNSFYWDTKGSDFLGATVLPFYGDLSQKKNTSFLATYQGNAGDRLWIYQKNKSKRLSST
ncbi:hypothetical protein [Paenibacillus sp. OSY-SE]|uniref:hypothetical protein n=1 Tax=Paenibacillus sp. OSY-SE TaxID=1196323 RepID=UPI0002D83D58